jgi:hypothetical protein
MPVGGLPAFFSSQLGKPKLAAIVCGVTLVASCLARPRAATSAQPQKAENQAPASAMAASTLALDAGVIDRMRGALWGVYIADALSMPVHW